MYDPQVVDTFVRVYKDIAPVKLPESRLDAVLGTFRGANAAVPAAGLAPTPTPSQSGGSAPGELLAFVSLARLAAGTPTLGDVGALAEGHLRHIAPNATIALYGFDATRSLLTAQYTAGPEAAIVAKMSIRLGERLTGWVGANLRGMQNADAKLDLLEVTPMALRAACATPLVHDGVLVGVLTLYAAAPLSDDQCRTLDMIAPHLSSAVAAIEARTLKTSTVRQSRSSMRVVASR